MVRFTSKYKDAAIQVYDAFRARGDVTRRKLKGATPADATWLVCIERATVEEVKSFASNLGCAHHVGEA